MKHRCFWLPLLAALLLFSCTNSETPFPVPGEPPFDEQPGGAPGTDDGNVPDFDTTIEDYNGERADDAAEDRIGDNEDLYWELNTFKNRVTVRYEGATATVEGTNEKIAAYVDGAHVVLDLQTGGASGVEIELSGKSDDGSLKIYGSKKFKLTLNSVEINSSRGPAINSQCKKRIYLHLADGSVNRLSDAAEYGDDSWYIEGAAAGSEDRKGALFSEGHLIVSGTGVLVVRGRKKHGIASDGYLYTRPGVTIAVTEAAKNAIHIKGDADDGIGICIAGGLIYTNTASEAGKGLKCDFDVEILGGRLDLNTSGDAIYDADENDTSSAAGIKTDGDIRISGGTISVKSTGTGGKGINADGNLTIAGGTTTLVTTGGKFVYNAALDLEASPKGAKADGDIVIDGGLLKISVTGVSDGSEGLESKSTLTINGGELYIYAYDDAINAARAITINGGRIYAYAVNNDGIDSNGTLTVNGGLVLASGSNAPEEGFDCDRSADFIITGGILIGTGGAAISPSSASTQRTVIYNGIQIAKDELLTLLDASGAPVMTCAIPRSMNSMALFFSAPNLAAGASYTLCKSGTLTDPSESWNGWYAGGSWSGGSTIGSFTSNSLITVVGNSSGPGGGGGNPGGGPGGPGGSGGGWPGGGRP